MVVSLANIGVNALNFSTCAGKDKFDFCLVEIPSCCFDTSAHHRLFKLVVIACNFTIFKVLKFHFIIIVAVCEHTAQTKLNTCLLVGLLKCRTKFVGVKRCYLVTCVEIYRRIFLCNNVYRAAESRTSKTVRHDTFIYFDSFNKVGGNIIKRHIIRKLTNGSLVDINTHTLTFETAHRYAGSTSHAAGISYCNTRCS